MLAIRGYQKYLSKYTGTCRYNPSCSNYAFQSIQKFGAFRGLYLTGIRLFDCSQKKTKGVYPVPNKFQFDPVNKGVLIKHFDTKNFSNSLVPKSDLDCCECGELECCGDCCCGCF